MLATLERSSVRDCQIGVALIIDGTVHGDIAHTVDIVERPVVHRHTNRGHEHYPYVAPTAVIGKCFLRLSRKALSTVQIQRALQLVH